MPAFAAKPTTVIPKPNPKATGGIGYTIGFQRYADFNAHQLNTECSLVYDTTGAFGINVDYLGFDYPETLVLTQSGSDITGGSLNTIPPAAGSAFTVTGGSVVGSAVNIYADHVSSTLEVHLIGEIANDGSMNGTWSDLGPGTRKGTWASTSGSAASSIVGCNGKGEFNYSDVNGTWYKVDVQYVKISGNDAWFAGPVVSGNAGAGQWLLAGVEDNGTPGSNGDNVWGNFMAEDQAKLGVATMIDPVNGPFPITSGNLVVHKN